jgi:protein-S-isoprenylcysteine O-methyltransferase Ste14
VNNHFETTVRIQTDRNHRVCTTGPYRFVRHPAYLAMVIAALTTPFVLGSWWACAPTVLVVAAVIFRTAMEDRVLRKELEGYRDYADRITRYRLVPLVW